MTIKEGMLKAFNKEFPNNHFEFIDDKIDQISHLYINGKKSKLAYNTIWINNILLLTNKNHFPITKSKVLRELIVI